MPKDRKMTETSVLIPAAFLGGSEADLKAHGELWTFQLFCLDHVEWVIARSIEDALSLVADVYGDTWEEMAGEPLGNAWSVLTLDQTLTVHDEEGGKETCTAKDWILNNGRGLLCSANW